MHFPDDADGDAMMLVLSRGSDPALPMEIDFMIACPDVEAAEQIAPLVAAQGYRTKIVVDEGEPDDAGNGDEWSVTCYCMRLMLLDYDALIASQIELHSVAAQYNGYIDGWGTFGNKAQSDD